MYSVVKGVVMDALIKIGATYTMICVILIGMGAMLQPVSSPWSSYEVTRRERIGDFIMKIGAYMFALPIAALILAAPILVWFA